MSFKKGKKAPAIRNKSSKQNLKEAAVKAAQKSGIQIVEEAVAIHDKANARGMVVAAVGADGTVGFRVLGSDLGTVLTLQHILSETVRNLANQQLAPKQPEAEEVEESEE